MVVVVAAEWDPMSFKLKLGDQLIPFKPIGHDPVSRLGFINVRGTVIPKRNAWIANVGAHSSADLQYSGPGGLQQCRTAGWVKVVSGKVLPISLLHVDFNGEVPPPGTPLTDGAGRVVGIMFQDSGIEKIGYAIPAEAVHRVQKDICNGGHLIRGWLGLALRAELATPKICRVIQDSPAAAAGIKPGDLLMSIGTRQISNYADAANAFFYLIPGEPVRVKLQRGDDQLELTLTPTLRNG